MLRWREAAEKERVWIVDPAHPIVAGITDEFFEIEHSEMYGEHFDIPAPDELVLVSWFEGGEVFRSGCTWHRGRGRVVYLRPGHETHPTYFDGNVRRVIANAVRWAALPRGAALSWGPGMAKAPEGLPGVPVMTRLSVDPARLSG